MSIIVDYIYVSDVKIVLLLFWSDDSNSSLIPSALVENYFNAQMRNCAMFHLVPLTALLIFINFAPQAVDCGSALVEVSGDQIIKTNGICS